MRAAEPRAAPPDRLSPRAVDVIAQSLPWPAPLTDPAATALALDAEYRIREIVQDSIKYMKHSKRACLAPQDLNAALRLRDVAPVYGFGGSQFARERAPGRRRAPAPHALDPRFHPVEDTDSLFYTHDREISVLTILERTPRKLPIRTTISAHWLAVDCSQPATHQNPGKAIQDARKSESDAAPKTRGPAPAAVDVKPIVKHDLSMELQLYYEQVTTAVTGDDLHHLETCLSSVKIQTGIEQMLPYLTQFIFRTVTKSTQDLPVLFSTMRLTKAILENPAFNVEGYLQQVLPAVATCIVGKRLCSDPWENHWALRDFSANIAAAIFEKFGNEYLSLRPRFTKTIHQALLDLRRPLTTHYGAIVVLASLGPQVVKQFLLPNLNNYTKKLRLLLVNPSVKPVRRLEAAKVVGAILWAAPKAFGSPASTDTDPELAPAKAVIEELREFEITLQQELKQRLFPYGDKLSDFETATFLHNHKRLEMDRNLKKS